MAARLARGVAPDRLRFADYVPAAPGLGQGALLARYHEADLALDTFPYGGMTTTLDALWMGVPVVSLVGRRNLGRAGLSLLSNVGLAEFAVADVDAYVETALRLAADRSRLAELPDRTAAINLDRGDVLAGALADLQRVKAAGG